LKRAAAAPSSICRRSFATPGSLRFSKEAVNVQAMWRARLGSAVCVLLLALASRVHAQADAASATLTGTVTDATGAVVPGVTVTITSVQRGTTRSTLTDRVGAYRVPVLEPGQYNLRIELTGFSPRVFSGIELSVGQVAVYDAQLSIGAITRSVEVTATTPVSDPRRTQPKRQTRSRTSISTVFRRCRLMCLSRINSILPSGIRKTRIITQR
jgi:hypothetical protein